MAITKQDIWNAADALDTEGVRPTLLAVRKRIGAGSFTTISEAMSEWKAAKAGPTEAREPPPAPLMERFTALAGEVWTQALESARVRFAAEREAMEVEKAELAVRQAEAVELADILTAELDQLRNVAAERDEARERLAAVTREHEKLTEALSTMTERFEAEARRHAETREKADADVREARQEVKDALTRAARLEGELDALKAQLAESRLKAQNSGI